MPNPNRFFNQPFGSDAVLRDIGSHVRRIEHGRQEFHIVPESEVLLVLNLTAKHRISGRFDGRYLSDIPLIHSISVMPPGRRFDVAVDGRCRILAVTVPIDRLAGANIEPRFNIADPHLAMLTWRSALNDDAGESLSMLRQHLVKPPKDRTRRETICAARLHKVFRFVEGSLTDPITTADLAAVAGMSMFHFSRAFAATTGTTPHRYVLGRRLAQAVAAVERGSVLEDVAFEFGFANASHLAHHLREGTGTTSRALRDFLTR